jgi:hypothetical protein
LYALFNLPVDQSQEQAHAILIEIEKNLTATTPNTVSPDLYPPIFTAFLESGDAGVRSLLARLIIFLLSNSDDLSPFREFSLAVAVKTMITTSEVPSLTVPLIELINAHFVCADYDLVSDWVSAFPVQFFADLLPNLPQMAALA